MEEQTSFNFNLKSKKTILTIVGVLVLLVALPLAVYLAQQKQIFKPRAGGGAPPISGPETSFTLTSGLENGPQIVPLGQKVRVSVLVRSDIDAANLFAAKLKFSTNTLEVEEIIARESSRTAEDTGFIKNWVEKDFNNQTGLINLVGGVPNPGFQTTINGASGKMAEIVFKAKTAGDAYVDFNEDAAIFRNSDNSNILGIKRPTDFRVVSAAITPTEIPGVSTERVRRVFITSTGYNSGNLGGLVGADAKCQARADAANLNGRWKAWLSDSEYSVVYRFFRNPGPYKLVNGVTIADNWNDLTDGTLKSPIDVDEFGNEKTGFVWTNTTINGGRRFTNSNQTCNNFKANNNYDAFLGTGFAGFADAKWTEHTNGSFCNVQMPLYCFEQSSAGGATPTPTPAGILGDVNSDGKITLVDMSALLSKWGKSGAEAGRADLNNDGVVNTIDYSLMIKILIENKVIKSASEAPAAP